MIIGDILLLGLLAVGVYIAGLAIGVAFIVLITRFLSKDD